MDFSYIIVGVSHVIIVEQITRHIVAISVDGCTVVIVGFKQSGEAIIESMFKTIRRNMKPQIMPLEDRLLLRKRAVIEAIHNIWKSALHIDHTRHRSVDNFVVNLLAGLVAYCHRPNKPTVSLPVTRFVAWYLLKHYSRYLISITLLSTGPLALWHL